MRKVVCNTTPILSLLKIGQLHLLKDMYGEIIIPRAVYDEIEVGKNWKYYIDLSKEGWVKIQKVLITSVSRSLDELVKKGVWLSPKITQQVKELAGEFR